jgi:hypothetical protein
MRCETCIFYRHSIPWGRCLCGDGLHGPYVVEVKADDSCAHHTPKETTDER